MINRFLLQGVQFINQCYYLFLACHQLALQHFPSFLSVLPLFRAFLVFEHQFLIHGFVVNISNVIRNCPFFIFWRRFQFFIFGLCRAFLGVQSLGGLQALKLVMVIIKLKLELVEFPFIGFNNKKFFLLSVCLLFLQLLQMLF